MLEKVETYFLDTIRGKRVGLISSLLRACLRTLSWAYQVIVAGRNWVFDHGWVRRYSPPVPVVISIGNIVAGGTGKTPVTLMLAREFYDLIPLAILSRGYRSEAERLATPVVLSRGQGPMHPPSYCGDEPYMLAQNLPKAYIFVGKDRHKSSNMAARAGAQLILLDDGMQHRRLARDFEVVVLDACDPFGLGYFLPRGLLREGLKALARADLIILNHVYDRECFLATRQKVSQYTTAPVVATKTEVDAVLDYDGKLIETIQDRVLGVFCGIAHPDYFVNTVLNAGGKIVASHFVPDHMDYDPAEMAHFAKKCKELGAEFLICTEKDRVKLANIQDLALPIIWIRMRLALVHGEAQWKAFIERAKLDLTRRL